jgi:hypothetical protein
VTPADAVADDSVGPLYDFSENCYAAVVFSHQALEAFANPRLAETIAAETGATVVDEPF